MLRYVILFCFIILTLSEYVAGICFHSPLFNIIFAMTLMCVINSVEVCIPKDNMAFSILTRVSAPIVALAWLFLNLSHIFEEITDIHESSNHTENESDSTTNFCNIVNDNQLYLTYVDFCCKLISPVIVSFQAVGFFRNVVRITSLLILPPLTAIGLAFFDVAHEYHKLEAYVCLVLTVYVGIVLFLDSKPYSKYLLLKTPPSAEADMVEIIEQAKLSHSQLQGVSHFHTYECWPNRIEVIMDVMIKKHDSDADHVMTTVDSFNKIRDDLTHRIIEWGANEVIINPQFMDDDESQQQSSICVARSCHFFDQGCCKLPNDNKKNEDEHNQTSSV